MALGDLINIAPSGSLTVPSGKYYAVQSMGLDNSNAPSIQYGGGSGRSVKLDRVAFQAPQSWVVLPPGMRITAASSFGVQLVERESTGWHYYNGSPNQAEYKWTPSSGTWEMQAMFGYATSRVSVWGAIDGVSVAKGGGSQGVINAQGKVFVNNSFPITFRTARASANATTQLAHLFFIARRLD